MKLIWLQRALDERKRQLLYIGRHNPNAAIGLGIRILHQTNQLVHFPELGWIGRRANTRELVVSQTPFIAIYRAEGDTVKILRLLHSKQRWPRGAR